MTVIVAHRGASARAPENTMEAFRLAHEDGADAIELDVHLTADGQLAVIHDDTLERTTDRNRAVPRIAGCVLTPTPWWRTCASCSPTPSWPRSASDSVAKRRRSGCAWATCSRWRRPTATSIGRR